jgi:hypothetical protein
MSVTDDEDDDDEDGESECFPSRGVDVQQQPPPPYTPRGLPVVVTTPAAATPATATPAAATPAATTAGRDRLPSNPTPDVGTHATGLAPK